jgi:hypothetical protein
MIDYLAIVLVIVFVLGGRLFNVRLDGRVD